MDTMVAVAFSFCGFVWKQGTPFHPIIAHHLHLHHLHHLLQHNVHDLGWGLAPPLLWGCLSEEEKLIGTWIQSKKKCDLLREYGRIISGEMEDHGINKVEYFKPRSKQIQIDPNGLMDPTKEACKLVTAPLLVVLVLPRSHPIPVWRVRQGAVSSVCGMAFWEVSPKAQLMPGPAASPLKRAMRLMRPKCPATSSCTRRELSSCPLASSLMHSTSANSLSKKCRRLLHTEEFQWLWLFQGLVLVFASVLPRSMHFPTCTIRFWL